ncbi:MAG: phosphoribosylformylglycinamidine synthase [Acidaminococcales bacterium]|jgi:phosphoribosylformylglycinamidine synthase|nr:phosphoribosylformylglycinamidine synthase [Acidaminococcales bacterium]
MPEAIKRIFVEKRPGFAVEAAALLADLKDNLGIGGLEKVRILNRYDVSGVSEDEFAEAARLVMSEPPVDDIYLNDFFVDGETFSFAVEYLPGQYDQRADSAAQCIRLIARGEGVLVKTARVFVLCGNLCARDVELIKKYCINPVEAREAKSGAPCAAEAAAPPGAVKRLEGFSKMTAGQLQKLSFDLSLAMGDADLVFCQQYFKDKGRDPTVTEIKALDTYWSDHCRHTTFNTVIDKVEIPAHRHNDALKAAYALYLKDRETLGAGGEPVTLMDMALLGMKKLRAAGELGDLDLSDEANACSIEVAADIGGERQEWLVMFKNETHNHPTEIEPFGGAATCLGGAIRDPLSGRAWVYQAMRVTGGADPRAPVRDTLEGKLPQRKIAAGAAAGYSSYGNQVGIATGMVRDFYHDRFLAKRMEVGAVIGAVPKGWVRRARPEPGDRVILLGGRTGRDGCGGATGSSKKHTVESLTDCGAQVQKGNALTERKILRLFRNPEATGMIKRCNDFGAGGVAVAIGELAAGVRINLDCVPKKYDGLDGTELAISESQERMAIVVAASDCERFIQLAGVENLEAAAVAEVTEEKRLVMQWRGDVIVDIDREFLDTNGVKQHAEVLAKPPDGEPYFYRLPPDFALGDLKTAWMKNLASLAVCSQKGLVERFDSTIGRGSVLMPLGGANQLTPAEGMAANIPALSDDVRTATVMAYGYNPGLACWSPFYGALYAVVESVCRAVAMGAAPDSIRLSLQEYFEKMANAESWGKPFAALLGAYLAQIGLSAPAIGGKDSMSGTFMDINVPPTLISFAVGIAETACVTSAEFKSAGHKVVFLSCEKDRLNLPDFAKLKAELGVVHKAIREGEIAAAATIKEGGIAAALSLMCFGNGLGFVFSRFVAAAESLFVMQPGGFLLELSDGAEPEELFDGLDWMLLGETDGGGRIEINGQVIGLNEAKQSWEGALSDIFPACRPTGDKPAKPYLYKHAGPRKHAERIARPRVFIPVFPGTNCEYDTARAFSAAGGEPEIFVVRNRTNFDIIDSVKAMAEAVGRAQIIALAGGFSAADEPDGSGKFIATMFRNPRLKEAIAEFLEKRGGLMLGICNGFQALIKLGLLPYGEITELMPDSPTLTFNAIGRHVSAVCGTKVVSCLSPWLALDELGAVHKVAISSGEGRFYADGGHLRRLFAAGQVATQYVGNDGLPAVLPPCNPNGSVMAVEGLTSPDGRIFGKMCHSERWIPGLMKNIPGNKEQKIFKAGVNYFA